MIFIRNEEMILFEVWYTSSRWSPGIDYEDDLRKGNNGEYYYQETYWMYRAFCAGRFGIDNCVNGG